MASAAQYHESYGRVVEVIPPYKAVVELKYKGKPARALLKVEKIPQDTKPGEPNKGIADLVQVGSSVRFSCHNFDETREDRCAWFIAEVYSIHKTEYDVALYSNIVLCPTVVNEKGTVLTLDGRQGSLYFTKDGTTHEVMFLANNFYVHQKKFPMKQTLSAGNLNLDDYVFFDAIPTDPNENDLGCSWFATLVWQGTRPDHNYGEKVKEDDPTLSTIKTITKNPRSDFLRGRGHIMKILNEEYGIILGAVNKKQTHWQTILFHRSKASLFKLKLSKGDLRTIFKTGDRVRFIAVRAPRSFSTEWVAAQVTVDCGEDAFRSL